MIKAICIVSAAAIRKEPSHRSEMISQLLFGETMLVLEEKEEWRRIKCSYDGYEGWLTFHLIEAVTKDVVTNNSYITTGLLNPVTLPDGLINLPMGSSLTGFDEETRLLWDGAHKYHGTYRNTASSTYNEDLFWNTIQPWMNAPYLWGGRTFMGVDCSGFVQTVYKVLGIALLRDAYQQVTQGMPVDDLVVAQPGDVAFFENDGGKITHVGIILQGDQIIHASGKVRVDVLTEKGIFNTENSTQTHKLHSIRRMVRM